MICISIVSKTTESAIEKMKKANLFADMVEIRLDYIKKPDLNQILSAKLIPTIITITPKHENGAFEGTEEQRVKLLRQAIELGADYVDVNFGCPELPDIIKNKKDTKIIVSHHDFNKTPPHLESLYSDMKASGADIVKIAVYANTITDNLKILDLIYKSDTNIIAICMGPFGEISRVLAPLYGAYLTFASMETGEESAPGQIPAETLKSIYRIQDIQPGFQIYGIIGNPINKSKGYILHNTLFQQHGLNHIYLNFLVDDLHDFMNNVSPMVTGFSVTMPHKETILNYLDELDPIAEKIGAVNTVVKKNGKMIGCNTDMSGSIKALRTKTEIENKNVTILGAGGAARAIAIGIIENGGNVTVLNRTVEKAKNLARDLNCRWGALGDFAEVPTEILINMTSVGMHPHIEETPVDTKLVKQMIVFDGIYNPKKTTLLQEAEKNHCTVISGIEMFIHQAAEQFTLWTEKEANTDLLRKILE